MSPDPIQSILEDFSNQIRAEVQRQAMAALNGGFDHAPSRTASTGKQAARAVHSDSKGAKRDPALIEKLQSNLLAFVKTNPGLRIEQINKQLGTTTKELTLPIRKLIASKAMRTSGAKRSTTYHTASSVKTVANKVVKRKAKAKAKAKRSSKPAAKAAAAASA
jgi:hypothetical protein